MNKLDDLIDHPAPMDSVRKSPSGNIHPPLRLRWTKMGGPGPDIFRRPGRALLLVQLTALLRTSPLALAAPAAALRSGYFCFARGSIDQPFVRPGAARGSAL